MAFLFVGGEDSDFNKLGACAVDTANTAARRTGKARCSLKVASGALGDGWQAVFSGAASSFWLTGRGYFTSIPNVATSPPSHMVALLDAAGVRRLALVLPAGAYVSNYTKYWRLVKIDAAGAMTTLATAGNTLSTDTLQKVDLYVNYAVAGQVQVYLDGTKIIDYSGDVTTNSATALASAVFGQDHANGSSVADYWSEIIVSTTDTRSLSLVTMPPAAAGNAFNWTGATSDVNEVTLDDATLITSATAGEIAQTTVTTFRPEYPPLATPNCSTYGRSNCSRQDHGIVGLSVFFLERLFGKRSASGRRRTPGQATHPAGVSDRHTGFNASDHRGQGGAVWVAISGALWVAAGGIPTSFRPFGFSGGNVNFKGDIAALRCQTPHAA